MPATQYIVPPLGKQFYDYNPTRTAVRPKTYLSDVAPYGTYKSEPSYMVGRTSMGKRSRSVTVTKRRYKRRRRGNLRRRIPRTLTTQSKLVTCKVTDYKNLAGTGTLAAAVCQLNSVDDPMMAGTGQPLGYDQWKALYKRAVVLSSKIVIKYHNRGTSAAMVGVWPAPLNQFTTTLTDYEYYMETPGTKARLLSPEMDHCVISSARSTKRHLQVTNVRDNAELSIDLVSETAPTKLAVWQLFAQAVDQSSAYAVDAVVTITYNVLLLDPITPARSVET